MPIVLERLREKCDRNFEFLDPGFAAQSGKLVAIDTRLSCRLALSRCQKAISASIHVSIRNFQIVLDFMRHPKH